jgi:hypothetical protein
MAEPWGGADWPADVLAVTEGGAAPRARASDTRGDRRC